MPKRRTMWRMEGECGLPIEVAPDATVKNAVAMAVLKVSLAATVGAFSMLPPAAVALGLSSGAALKEARPITYEASDLDPSLRTSDINKAEVLLDAPLPDQGISGQLPTASEADAMDDAFDEADGSAAGGDTASGLVSDAPGPNAFVPSDDVQGLLDGSDSMPDDGFDLASSDSAHSLETTEGAEGVEDALFETQASGAVTDASSLEAALSAIGSSGTISLGANITVSHALNIPAGANVAFALGGHTLTGSGTLFSPGSGAFVAISGPGTVSCPGGSVFDGHASLGGLSITGGVFLSASGGLVFGGGSYNYPNTSISSGCSFTDTSMYSFVQGDQVVTFSNGRFYLQSWADPDSECWYAMALVAYCLTEADFNAYMKQFPGTDIVSYPSVEYDVTFRSASGSTIKKSHVFRGHCVGSTACGDAGAAPTEDQVQATVPAGHVFEGWEDAQGKLHSTNEILAMPVTADTVYTARYRDTTVYHDVTFVFGKDLAQSDTKSLAESQAVQLPDSGRTALQGYELLGWYDARTGGNRVCSATAAGDVLVSSPMTLYAHYRYLGEYPVSIRVERPNKTDKGIVNVVSGGRLSADQIPDTAPVEGYELDGWYVTSTGDSLDIGLAGASVDSKVDDPASVVIGQPMSFLAKYKKIDNPPIGPVDPNPGPDEPVDPTPVDPVPVVPNPGGSGSDVVPGQSGQTSDAGAGAAVRPVGAGPLEPHAPDTPWNPAGLALAAGFTVPASGPGVVTRELIEQNTSDRGSAGDGGAKGDGPDGSMFDAQSPAGVTLPLSAGEVAALVGMGGGTAIVALIASRIATFLSTNGVAAAAAGLGMAGAAAGAAAGATGGGASGSGAAGSGNFAKNSSEPRKGRKSRKSGK